MQETVVKYVRRFYGYTISSNADIMEELDRKAGDRPGCVCKSREGCDGREECQRMDIDQDQSKAAYQQCRYVEIIRHYSIEVEIKAMFR